MGISGMGMSEIILSVIISAGIPSALVALLIRRLEKRNDEKEKARHEINVLMITAVRASISIGEASAIALKNGKTNGETEEALEYAKEAKKELTKFLVNQGAKAM